MHRKCADCDTTKTRRCRCRCPVEYSYCWQYYIYKDLLFMATTEVHGFHLDRHDGRYRRTAKDLLQLKISQFQPTSLSTGTSDDVSPIHGRIQFDHVEEL
jgi:hypothetical protein